MPVVDPILVEAVPGADTCLLAFGGHNHALGVAPFEFYKSADALGWSRILVRDLSRTFYQRGIGDFWTPRPLWQELRRMVDDSGAKKLVITGASVGGWMALMATGSGVLNPGRCVLFNPLATLSRRQLAEMNDNRWDAVMMTAWEFPGKWSEQMGLDAAEAASWATCPIDVHYCATDLHDPKHAAHLEELPHVTLYDWPCIGHATGRYMREQGLLADALRGNLEAP